MAKRISLARPATAIDLGLSLLEREVVDSARDALASEKERMAREVAAMIAASKDGQACKTFSEWYTVAVVAELLGMSRDDAGLKAARDLMAEGATRDKTQQNAIFAARNRLKRRLQAAGLESATPRRPRQPKGGKKDGAKGGAVRETPKLATPRDWVNFFVDVKSLLENVQRVNDKSMDAKAKACMEDLMETLTYHAKKAR